MKQKTVIVLYVVSMLLLAVALLVQWMGDDMNLDTTIPIAILVLIATRTVLKRRKSK